MPTTPIEISVIIPCYNEGTLLEKNVSQLLKTLEYTSKTFEIIFVDDFSTDDTRASVEKLVTSIPNSSKIFNQENVGRGGAFMIGAAMANGKYLGYLDIDLEVSDKFLPDVIKALDEGADVATVYRDYQLKWYPIFLIRAYLSKGYKKLVKWYLKLPLKDTETGFKFFRADAYNKVAELCEDKHWFWDTEIMAWSHYKGLKIVEVPGVFEKKKEKVSTVRIIPDTFKYFRALRKFKYRLRKSV